MYHCCKEATTTPAKRLDLRHCITLLPVIVCSRTAVVTAQTSCSTDDTFLTLCQPRYFTVTYILIQSSLFVGSTPAGLQASTWCLPAMCQVHRQETKAHDHVGLFATGTCLTSMGYELWVPVDPPHVRPKRGRSAPVSGTFCP